MRRILKSTLAALVFEWRAAFAAKFHVLGILELATATTHLFFSYNKFLLLYHDAGKKPRKSAPRAAASSACDAKGA
jgi:hypothetical protein